MHLHVINRTLHTDIVDLSIRQYRAADFDRLWRIDQLCFPPGIAYTQMDLSGFITRRKAITLIAEYAAEYVTDYPVGSDVAREIAGFAVAQPIRNIGRILTLDILPEARRSGLATRLMREIEMRLRAGGCRQVYLETAVNNEPALRLYQKLGYEILRKLPLYYPTHALDGYLMGKVLYSILGNTVVVSAKGSAALQRGVNAVFQLIEPASSRRHCRIGAGTLFPNLL